MQLGRILSKLQMHKIKKS